MPGFAVIVRPLAPQPDGAAIFEVAFQGFQAGAELNVGFWETRDRTKGKPEGTKRLLGALSGKLVRHGGTKRSPLFGLAPEAGPKSQDFAGRPHVGFVLRPGGDPDEAHHFELQHDVEKRPEGELWEVTVQVARPKVKSPPIPLAWPRYRVPSRAKKPQATYDWHAGNDIKLYNDGSEDAQGTKGAFADIVEAIGKARHFIFVVDWSFHPLMVPKRDKAPALEDTIGAMLVQKAREGVVVAIHTWNHMDPAPDDQNNHAGEILRWIAARTGDKSVPKTLFWRAGYREIATTHHQKFVALDWHAAEGKRRELGVFWGGLDLTKGRFDWPEHPILAFDPAYAAPKPAQKQDPPKAPGPNPLAATLLEQLDFGGTAYSATVEAGGAAVTHGDDWYNAELLTPHIVQPGEAKDGVLLQVPPRQPWHDIHARLVGPVAWDFVREFVGRWNVTTSWGIPIWKVGTRHDVGDKGADDTPAVQDVLFNTLADRDRFVQQWEGGAGAFAAQMLRSMVPGHWHRPMKNPGWHPKREEFDFKVQDFERSIQDSYLRALERAERFVYIETQYLIGSGRLWDRPNQTGVANRIPETLVARILERAKDKKPFHAYLLIPMYPEGAPNSAAGVAIRRFEWRTMWYMIRAVDQAVKKLDPKASWKQYLSFYFLAQWHRDDGAVELAKDHQTDVPRASLMNANKRHMIYIHSKLMIVDDRYLIVGSANLNERSLAGDRDSEDCVAMWPSGPIHEEACVTEIQRLRERLWDEHLGADKPGGWKSPEAAACVDAVRKAGLENWKGLRGGKRPGKGHLVLLPFELGEEGTFTKATVSFPEIEGLHVPDGHASLPDALDPTDSDWKWDAPGMHILTGSSLPE